MTGAALTGSAERADPRRFAGVRSAVARSWMEMLMRAAHRAPVVPRLARPLALFVAWRTSPWLRDGSMANAARLLGPGSGAAEREALARRIVRNFYDFVCDMGRHRTMERDQLAGLIEEVRGEENYRRARALRRGAIIVTAHLGSFELGAAMLGKRERRVYVVFRRDRVSSFEQMRSEQRARLGIVEVPLDDGWGVWLRLREALLADEVVLLQGDRVLAGQSGVRVRFMGGHLEIPAGPIKLAMATGAPIVPIFTVRGSPGRFRVIIEEPILVEPGPARWDGPHPALVRLAGVLERVIAAHPDQWLMLERAWCEDRPPPQTAGLP